MPRLKTKVERKLTDVIDMDTIRSIREKDRNFSLSKIFRPHMTKLVNYNNKTVLCYDLKKFVKKFKLDVDFSILELMDDFYAKGYNPVLAGGKLISFLNGERLEDSTNDYDLYFLSEEDRFHLQDNIWTYFKDNDLQMVSNLAHLWEFLLDTHKEKSNGEALKIKIQMMFKAYACVEHIIETFDLRCCAVAYHKGKIYWVKGALRDIKEKKITLLSPRPDFKGFTRVTKYLQKGYDIAIPDLLAMSVLSLDPIVTATQQFEYNYQNLNAMIDRDARFDRNNMYDPEEIYLDRDVIFEREMDEPLQPNEFTFDFGA